MGKFMDFIEILIEKIKVFLVKYKIDYKRIGKFLYYLFILSIILNGILLSQGTNLENIKYVFSDRRNESNIIKIDGIWGTISQDGILENSAFPALVREENTPIYNLDRNSFASSEKTLEMFYEKIKNNDIYVLFDTYSEDLEKNMQVITLKNLNYEIVSIEKIYTADEISYIDASTTWVLAKVKYVGE
jgi:hypothetical protein